ncbi:hypothetical protein CPC08DRAFT_714896 [Agrocybe pediades]|nr:hypothetical protein CPC08DRAFT_714896 [Agrocybe pediades]
MFCDVKNQKAEEEEEWRGRPVGFEIGYEVGGLLERGWERSHRPTAISIIIRRSKICLHRR